MLAPDHYIHETNLKEIGFMYGVLSNDKMDNDIKCLEEEFSSQLLTDWKMSNVICSPLMKH